MKPIGTLILCALLILVFTWSQKVNSAQQQKQDWIYLTCVDIDNQIKKYNGHRDLFSIAYSSGYISVKTKAGVKYYPSHLCTVLHTER